MRVFGIFMRFLFGTKSEILVKNPISTSACSGGGFFPCWGGLASGFFPQLSAIRRAHTPPWGSLGKKVSGTHWGSVWWLSRCGRTSPPLLCRNGRGRPEQQLPRPPAPHVQLDALPHGAEAAARPPGRPPALEDRPGHRIPCVLKLNCSPPHIFPPDAYSNTQGGTCTHTHTHSQRCRETHVYTHARITPRK